MARCVGTLDVAELALEAKIGDFADIFSLEFFGIDFGIFALRAILVDGVEHRRKTAAILDAHAAVGAQTEDALDFGAQIFFVVESGIRRIVSGLVGHWLLLIGRAI